MRRRPWELPDARACTPDRACPGNGRSDLIFPPPCAPEGKKPPVERTCRHRSRYWNLRPKARRSLILMASQARSRASRHREIRRVTRRTAHRNALATTAGCPDRVNVATAAAENRRAVIPNVCESIQAHAVGLQFGPAIEVDAQRAALPRGSSLFLGQIIFSRSLEPVSRRRP